jgi:antitoxin ParD1/3/4
MNITIRLTDEQQAWLAAQVSAGAFPTIEAAVQQAIAERMAFEAANIVDDDLAWAKPLVDEARASVARGDNFTLEEHRARNAARRALRR